MASSATFEAELLKPAPAAPAIKPPPPITPPAVEPDLSQVHVLPTTSAPKPQAGAGDPAVKSPYPSTSPVVGSGLGQIRVLPAAPGAKPQFGAPARTDEPKAGGWALRPGHPELTASFGINAARYRVNPVGLTGTAGIAIGIKSYLAGFGSYSYNSVGSEAYDYGGYSTSVSGRLHELVGGLRCSLPARFSPYAEFFGGAVRPTASVSVMGVSASAGINEPAFGAGGGFNVAFSPHFGMVFNVRVLRPRELQWYGHATVGFYSRL